MTDPKRLTPEELAEIARRIPPMRLDSQTLDNIREVWSMVLPPSDDDSAASHVVRLLLSHVAALNAENATMRQLLAELTAGEEAGVVDGEQSTFCVYCNLSDYDLDDSSPYTHTPDCPIVRGRALLEEG